eukprot:scaffold3935_cov51-Phaeocystis_antarctica.AAC.3
MVAVTRTRRASFSYRRTGKDQGGNNPCLAARYARSSSNLAARYARSSSNLAARYARFRETSDFSAQRPDTAHLQLNSSGRVSAVQPCRFTDHASAVYTEFTLSPVRLRAWGGGGGVRGPCPHLSRALGGQPPALTAQPGVVPSASPRPPPSASRGRSSSTGHAPAGRWAKGAACACGYAPHAPPRAPVPAPGGYPPLSTRAAAKHSPSQSRGVPPVQSRGGAAARSAAAGASSRPRPHPHPRQC